MKISSLKNKSLYRPNSFLIPGRTLKGKVMKIIDSNHYLIKINGKEFLSFSEVQLQPEMEIFAEVKGTFPNVFLKIKPFLPGLPNMDSLLGSNNLSDQLLFNQIFSNIDNPALLTDNAFKLLFSFVENKPSLSELMNTIANQPGMRELIDESFQVNVQNGLLMIRLNEYNDAQEKAMENILNFFDKVKSFLLRTKAGNEQTNKELMRETIRSTIGAHIYNHYNQENNFYFPILFFYEKWHQALGSFKKEKEESSISILLDYSTWGTTQLQLSLYQNEYLSLKVYNKNQDLLSKIDQNKQKLYEALEKYDILLKSLELIKYSGDIHNDFFFRKDRAKSVVDFQV